MTQNLIQNGSGQKKSEFVGRNGVRCAVIQDSGDMMQSSRPGGTLCSRGFWESRALHPGGTEPSGGLVPLLTQLSSYFQWMVAVVRWGQVPWWDSLLSAKVRDIVLVSPNQPQWEYLHHRHGHLLHVNTLTIHGARCYTFMNTPLCVPSF